MSTIPPPAFNPPPATPLGTRAERVEQLRTWMSPLNVHVAAAAVLLLFTLWLLVQVVLALAGTGSRGEDAIAQARAQQVAAEIAARPLRGVDSKLAASEAEANNFYQTRFPYGYADVAAELGRLREKTGVRLGRVQYLPSTPANGVSEVRIDAAVTGEYKPLALFINGLERDRTFFQIQNITLNGQQSGVVSLRLRIVTYLREPMPGVGEAQAEGGGRP